MTTSRPSLVSRLALGIGAAAALSGLLVGVPLRMAARTLLEASLQERAEASAETIAVAIGEPGDPTDPRTSAALAARLADLAEEADLDRLDLDDASGHVLLSTEPAILPGEADALLAEAGVPLATLAERDAATTPLRTDAAGLASVVAVAPIDGAVPPLFVAVRAPASWTAPLDTLSLRIALAVAAWVVAAAGLGAVVARRGLAPLRRLGGAARALAEGDDAAELPRSGLPEIDALADDFERMRAAIGARERWLRALAGTVAHEVRNPAHALRLHLGLLRRRMPADEAVQARFARIDNELDELEATVSSLLAFAEGAPARRVPTDLRALLARAAPDAAIEAGPELVSVDPVLVGRAVANLVRNAHQAGAKTVTIRAVVDAGVVTLRVLDDGAGFDPCIVARALEPFARAEKGGTGLGLALVAAVARAHGGHARIVAPGPGGTVVEVLLTAA